MEWSDSRWKMVNYDKIFKHWGLSPPLQRSELGSHNVSPQGSAFSEIWRKNRTFLALWKVVLCIAEIITLFVFFNAPNPKAR